MYKFFDIVTNGASWRRWLIIVPSWLVVAVLFASQTVVHYQSAGRAVSWWVAYQGSAIYCLIWAIFTPVILYLSARLPIERQRTGSRLLTHLSISVVIALVQQTLFTLYEIECPMLPIKTVTPMMAVKSIFFMFDYGILIYWSILAVQHSIAYHKKSRHKEVVASELESQIMQSELHALKMQLQPQFLFSTLETISLLMHRDMRSADKMIARLGDFLRITLESSHSESVTLHRELDFLKCYLEIEQIRFKDKLKVDVQVEPRVFDTQVPHLILQALVENAIQNGIAAGARYGKIGITAQQNDGMLRIQVSNNTGHEPIEEFGLMNTRARLQQMYGKSHRLDLTAIPEGGSLVTIEIPIS
jgi:two-component system, LytTR family, sensor kinase